MNMIKCRKCGREIEDDVEYCYYCGWVLQDVEALDEDLEIPEVADNVEISESDSSIQKMKDSCWDYMQLETQERQQLGLNGRKEIKVAYRYFCPSCGARFADGKKFCDQCGTGLTELAQPETIDECTYVSRDEPSTGIAILGFLIPLAGFFMWVSWNNTMPRKAKSAGEGALIGVITYLVLSVICIGLIVS